eukprot:1368142-Pleurochrysis_carterae.AAC.2
MEGLTSKPVGPKSPAAAHRRGRRTAWEGELADQSRPVSGMDACTEWPVRPSPMRSSLDSKYGGCAMMSQSASRRCSFFAAAPGSSRRGDFNTLPPDQYGRSKAGKTRPIWMHSLACSSNHARSASNRGCPPKRTRATSACRAWTRAPSAPRSRCGWLGRMPGSPCARRFAPAPIRREPPPAANRRGNTSATAHQASPRALTA